MESIKYYLNSLKREVKLSFSNNKKYLLFSTLIFIIPMLVGYYFPDEVSSYIQPMVDTFKEQVADGTVTLTTNSLFFNNVEVAIILYALSALGAILGIVVLANNGIFIGYFGSMVALDKYLALTLPHGIFELPAIIISATGGFILLSFVIHFIYNLICPDYEFIDVFDPYFRKPKISIGQRFKGAFNKNQNKLKESFILLCVSVVLLIISAFIEANITIPLAMWIYSLFGITLV